MSTPAPPSSSSGARRKYSDELVNEVLDFMKTRTLTEASRHYGIPHSTINTWQKRRGLLKKARSRSNVSKWSTPKKPTPKTEETEEKKSQKTPPRSNRAESSSNVLPPSNSKYSLELIEEVTKYLEDHTVSQAARFYGIPHSTLFGWNKRTHKHVSSLSITQQSPSKGKRREKVLRYAAKHSVTEASLKFNVPKATVFRWRREQRIERDAAESSSSLDSPPLQKPKPNMKQTVKNDEAMLRYAAKPSVKNDKAKSKKKSVTKKKEFTWETRDRIVKFAKKCKDYHRASEKFGVTVAQIRSWMKPVKKKEDVKDDDKDFDPNNPDGDSKVGVGGRVKEYSDEVKEAAIQYGQEHGWTAAALRYGTSSTSVSRWATYNNPRAPWKLKVISFAKRSGVWQAARKYKVSQAKLSQWISQTSSKHRDKVNDEEEDRDEMEDDDGDDEDDLEHCDVCDATLARDESLIEHIVTEHVDERGQCVVCGDKTEDVIGHFNDHLKTETCADNDHLKKENASQDQLKKKTSDKDDLKNETVGDKVDEITEDDVRNILKDLIVEMK